MRPSTSASYNSALHRFKSRQFSILNPQSSIPGRHRPHPEWRVRGSVAHGVGDLVNGHVPVVEEVIEPASVESVGGGSPFLLYPR